MRRSRFSVAEKLHILDAEQSGAPVKQICEQHGISPATFFRWKRELGVSLKDVLARSERLDQEVAELRLLVASQQRDLEALRGVIRGKG
jgi:putative transposase